MEPLRVNSTGKPGCKDVLGRVTPISGWRNGKPYFKLGRQWDEIMQFGGLGH